MANNFPIHHGIVLAENAYIENLNVELLASDPSPVGPGRLWFNQTSKVFKYSGLDGVGAVIVRTIAAGETVTSDISTALSTAQSYADTKKSEALAYTDAAEQRLLGGIPPATLDTINEIAAALNNNPNIVSVLNTTITDGIAAAKAELKGTVTAAMDTLGEIETAVGAVNTRVGNLEGQTDGKIGNLTTLHTDAKGTIVAAINEVQDEISAEVSARSTADTAIRTDYNARLFTFSSSTPATTHTITHNFNTDAILFSVQVKRDSGKYRNDVVSVEEYDSNTLKVYLSKAADVKMAVQSMVSL